MDNLVLEKKIREALEAKSREVRADALTGQRIRAGVHKQVEEAEHMKHGNWKKTALAAAAICILGSITAMGLGKTVMITGSSSPSEAMTSYAEAEAMQKSLDSHVKMVESFSNGYEFNYAVPRYDEAKDRDGNVTGKETSLNVTYAKEGMKDVNLSASRLTLEAAGEPDAVLLLEDGTELHYSVLVNKFVPADYEVTEEERKLQEEGKLNIGIGSDEIQIMPSSSVTWNQDGVSYCLFTFSQDMSADEMLAMAGEVAESE